MNTVFHGLDNISPFLVNLTILWDQLMGHIGEKGLRSMHEKCMVEGIHCFYLQVYFCENFIYCNESCVKFPFGSIRAEEILKLIHSDVFGQELISSLRGS